MATRDFDLYVNPELASKMEARLGELFNQIPKQTANNPNGNNQFRSNSRREEIDHVVSPVEIEDEPPPVKPKPKLEVAAATAKE